MECSQTPSQTTDQHSPALGDTAWSGDGSSGDLRPGQAGADNEGRVTGDPTAGLVMLHPGLPPPWPGPVLAPLQLSFTPPDPQSRNDSLCSVAFLIHPKGDCLHLATPNPSPPSPSPLTTSLFSGTPSPFDVHKELAECCKSTILQRKKKRNSKT